LDQWSKAQPIKDNMKRGLRNRWLTAIVAVPLLILLIIKGSHVVFACFIAIVCAIALNEYFRIAFSPLNRRLFSPIPVIGFCTGVAIIAAAHFKTFEAIAGLIVLNLIVCSMITVMEFNSASNNTLDTLFRQVLGVCYVPMLLGCIVLIHHGPDGIKWIFFLLILVFIGDTGAYYAGSYMGKHKLCPNVSPGKTIEGLIGGTLATLIAGSIFKAFLLPALPWTACLLMFLLIGIIGPLGDLFESEFKRAANIKDSGGILPGHGGILDRIDALLFASPIVYLFQAHVMQ
jgi:phosphatidate cytidylyltransferase